MAKRPPVQRATGTAPDAQVPASQTVLDPRFAGLVRAGVDAATLRTWDPTLPRWTRLLVPIDVQAFVMTATGGEPVVSLTGAADDPPPFAAGTALPAGVHLHWALPDALLSAQRASSASDSLALPALPDRWVVVRALQPVGARHASVRGWVIDAVTGSVTTLDSYAGTVAPGTRARLDPLDGTSGGSLLWTASYAASADRFALHDPLTDLRGVDGAVPAGRWSGDQAVYTVAGWWSDSGADPLNRAHGPAALDARLAELGWFDGEDSSPPPPPPPVLPSPQTPKLTAQERLRNAEIMLGGNVPSLAGLAAKDVVFLADRTCYATLLHGSVLGVPIGATLPAADDRPRGEELEVSIGHDLDDVVSALGASVLSLDGSQRRSAETLLAAFTGGVIEQLGSIDGLEDLAEREHADTFWPLPGPALPQARPDRLRPQQPAGLGPTTVGRRGRSAQVGATLGWADGRGTGASRAPAPPPSTAEPRIIIRPAPRFFRPQAPLVALRGARPNHRHHGDGRYEDNGRLRCRYPTECVGAIEGVVSGTTLLASLGSGAVPPEVLTVVREALLLNPYGLHWLTAAATTGAAPSAVQARLEAEMVRLYGVDGRYDDSSHLATSVALHGGLASFDAVSADTAVLDRQIAAELARHSLVAGSPPSPVGFTTWRQPWVPLWLEWRVRIDGTDTATGWRLDGLDLQPTPPAGAAGHAVSEVIVGRSVVGQGVVKALQQSISRWLDAERSRDATPGTALPPADADVLARLGDLLGPASGVPVGLDLVSASLDGIRERLLGIAYVGVVARAAGAHPRAAGPATPLFGGVLRIVALRLVDAFGRILEVPAPVVAATVSTAELTATAPLAPAGHPGMLMRPRIQHAARFLLRLVDPAVPAATEPAEAFVDQIEPARAVSPVAGFLLPDHIDEELEAFTAAGAPIGQLGHDAVNGAVTWEPAPGRPVPPDASPGEGVEPAARLVAEIAAGVRAADAVSRELAAPPARSALSALLRAVDTTLWSVDTFAAVGSTTVAGLVGRPLAVVRALLRLEAPDDLAEVDVSDPGGAEARRLAFAALAEQRFAVRLGTLNRADDALLGFYVDDDYAHLRLVDRVVADLAIESGQHRGHLDRLGAVDVPPVVPLEHPYLVPDPTIWVRPGQTVWLTLLMLPAGRVHLTSGILPRKQIALADDWVTPGLRRLVPSVRVGPVLVDPAEIRLPLVRLLGDKQTFTRRTGLLTWRDDAILAATQTAYLPRLPHEAQEGWVRVVPDESEGESS